MRILVTGASGQLGSSLRKAAENSPNEYIFTDADDLDITDPEAVALGVGCNDFQAIVNCAAYTNVDRAEEQEDIAEQINATAVGYLAKAAADNGIPLIHISTDYVFGGNLGNTPRTENEPLKPTGAYGRTKLHGEEAILKSGCRHIIIRTAWLYSEYGKNFVKTMLGLTSTRPQLNVVFDQAGTPTYAQDLADAIVDIIDNGKIDGNEGVYHYSDEGVCSWYDFTKMIAEIAGNTDCDIRPCHSDEFPSPVVRPSYSVLDKTKFKKT
ncbi:dTDP-4-dehydrorhamnose reductase, partial [Paramuribaculum intestinale]|uniref:dTDP-4-dehydrorhamnose reductase n=1 Tax=Paramuribaculum intestinale TaxID=2094151 RepID=UPI0027295CCD